MRLKRAGIITKIVVFALVIYASVTLIDLRSQIDAARLDQETLKQQISDKEVSNAELEYKIQHSGDDDTISDIARSDLGLVAPGEKVFYDTAN
jgi:cell division protein DivIC